MQKRSHSSCRQSDAGGITAFSILADEDEKKEEQSLFGNQELNWKGQRQTYSDSNTQPSKQSFIQQFPTLDLFMAYLLQPITREQQAIWQKVEQHDPVTQTANPEWLRSRLIKGYAKRLSGSSVGGIFGVNKYSSPIKSLSEFLWPSFRGNAACAYGNHHEPIVENMFLNWQLTRVINSEISECGKYTLKNIDILNYGLCARRELPLFGYSPDGVLEEEWQAIDDPTTIKKKRILIEYKCPYSRRNTTIKNIQEKLGDLYPQNRIPHTGFEDLTVPVPPQYYAQMMWGHRTLYDDVLQYSAPEECPPAYFVVWCPAIHPEIEERQNKHSSTSHDDDDDCTISDEEVDLSPLEFVEFSNSSRNSTFACSVEGTMQISRAKHDPVFCQKMEETCEVWWKEQYIPVLYDKLCGKIKHGEISCASTVIDILL